MHHWVDAAIASGAEPFITCGPVDRNGVPESSERYISTSLRGRDDFPRELFGEVYAMLRRMGRVRPGVEEVRS
jgi:hypothetical protein